MYSNFIPDKDKITSIKLKDLYLCHTEEPFQIIEMMNFDNDITFINEMNTEHPIDKRIKQLRLNINALIKIFNMNIDEELKREKIKTWVVEAREKDVRAAEFSTKLLRKTYNSNKHKYNHDEEIVEMYFEKYRYKPLECYFYDTILDSTFDDIYHIIKYVEYSVKPLPIIINN